MLILYLLLGGLFLILTAWGLSRLGILPGTKNEAEDRAEQLLRQHLTPTQYQQLQEQGYIEIPSQLHPGRLYRIFRRRRRAHIYVFETDGDTARRQKHGELCLVACDPVPDADLFLAQKWMIESDEKNYLTIANYINWAPRPIIHE